MDESDAITELAAAVVGTCDHLATECEHGRLMPGCRVCDLRVEAVGALDEHRAWVLAGQVLRDRLDDVVRELLPYVEEKADGCSWCVDLAVVLAEAAARRP